MALTTALEMERELRGRDITALQTTVQETLDQLKNFRAFANENEPLLRNSPQTCEQQGTQLAGVQASPAVAQATQPSLQPSVQASPQPSLLPSPKAPLVRRTSRAPVPSYGSLVAPRDRSFIAKRSSLVAPERGLVTPISSARVLPRRPCNVV